MNWADDEFDQFDQLDQLEKNKSKREFRKLIREDIKEDFLIILPFIIATVIGIGIIFAIAVGTIKTNTKKWNDGHCECGGNWVYEQPVPHENSTTYIYVCDRCGSRREFDMLR